jgi:TonB-linked SusC/RagA family outer membrane protein
MNNFLFYKGRLAIAHVVLCVYYLIWYSPPAYAGNRPNYLFTAYNIQQQQIQGIVSDASGPVPGISISVKGKNVTTVSNPDGTFSINTAPSDILVFAGIGFKTISVPVDGRISYKIVLEVDATDLEEVQINAGYYTVKRKEATGSISRITSKDIATQPVSNPLAALQGRMAGVEVTQSTGAPGGNFEIKIRGQNSLRADGNTPLYIIDGVPYSAQSTGTGYTTTAFPTGSSPLNGISPESIESIEVLKDADATAIYGSRGANGVVLITTKKGKEGKLDVSVTASTAAGRVTRFMELMHTKEYLAMRRQAFINDGISYGESDYDVNGTWDANRYTNWQKELTGKTAQTHNMQLSLSGGSAQTRFLLGGNYQKQTTVYPGNFDYSKAGANFSLSHDATDNKFSLLFSALYTHQNNMLPATDLTVSSRALAPNAPALYDPQGNLNWENNTWTNPLAALQSRYNARTSDLIANTVLQYRPVEGLLLKTSLGYTTTQTDEIRTNPSTIYNPSFNLGPEYSALFRNAVNRRSWIIEPQASYSTALGSGTFQALVGASIQEQNSNQITQFGSGFSSNNLIYNLASASFQQVVSDTETLYRYAAVFGRLNYDYKGRYLINLTARRDGSSRFGPGKRFSNFGAAGAAWIFSRETFLTDKNFLSFGKIRASYGTSGSDQIGDYQYLDTYSNSGISYQGTIGLQPSRLYNPNFSWETNRKLEVALELGFLKDQIYLTAAWYRNRSSSQLVGIPTPGTTGFQSIQANLPATVQNQGLEFSLESDNFKTDQFTWKTRVNFTLPKNKLLAFPGIEGSTYQNLYRIGHPLNVQLVYQYKGIDPQTGLYQFEDLNGDNQITSPQDRQKVVSLDPSFYGGLQNIISYRRWSLDFLFQFVKQKKPAFTMGAAGAMVNQLVAQVNSWQATGDNAPNQLYTTGVNVDAVMSQYLYDSSDAAIIDGSFIRLKNIALSYELPASIGVSCRIMIQGQNLVTITPYKGGDPEFAILGYLPPLKVLSAGVQLIF